MFCRCQSNSINEKGSSRNSGNFISLHYSDAMSSDISFACVTQSSTETVCSKKKRSLPKDSFLEPPAKRVNQRKNKNAKRRAARAAKHAKGVANMSKLCGISDWETIPVSLETQNSDNGMVLASLETQNVMTTDIQGVEVDYNIGKNENTMNPSKISPADTNEKMDPHFICGAADLEYKKDALKNNFLKGVQFSPDGLCLLTNSDDNIIRLFEFSDSKVNESSTHEEDLRATKGESVKASYAMKSCLSYKLGDTVYDFCWYPHMTSQNPQTCCFFTTRRESPIHIWDAYNGSLRGSYCAYNNVDEITSAASLACSRIDNKLYCGYNRMVRVFDISRPGSDCEIRPTTKSRKCRVGQRGLISSIDISPDSSGIYAAGSFDGSIGLYNTRAFCRRGMFPPIFELKKMHSFGVTKVLFSKNGQTLFSAGRKDSVIVCFDIRNTQKELCRLHRPALTNQKISFDIDYNNKWLVSGASDGIPRIWKLNELGKENNTCSKKVPLTQCDNVFTPFNDVVNSAAFHPYRNIVGFTTGQRHFGNSTIYNNFDSDSDESDCDKMHGSNPWKSVENEANILSIWNIK